MKQRIPRRFAAALAGGAAAVALIAGTTAPAAAAPSPAPPSPSSGAPSGPFAETPTDASAETPSGPFDFRDCPALPPGVDAAKWRCEVFVMRSSLRIGALDVPALAPMTVTNAEGPLPDGSRGQVFGALRAPTAPAGGRLRIQPQYGGHADFYPDGVHRGALDMTFRLVHPLLKKGCAIGTENDPVKLRFVQDGDTEWVSKEPPVVTFVVHDSTFTAPRTHGCGPLAAPLDRRLGLPAAAGANALSASAAYTFRSYAQLPYGR
ncbi:hypothetical protein [Streptomyces sp. NPDC048638]|uniref:hypothetical protein n=1 Tax=Streptomyces sp. NPDC048638 TaxID=3365580 RepID=UPI00371FC01E